MTPLTLSLVSSVLQLNGLSLVSSVLQLNGQVPKFGISQIRNSPILTVRTAFASTTCDCNILAVVLPSSVEGPSATYQDMVYTR
jgi:hypothetical protein